MSQLTDETKVVYCAVYYCSTGTCAGDVYAGESIDFDTNEEATEEAINQVHQFIKEHNRHYYAIIQQRIIPIYR